jgi:anti-sigma regulatory factor (Ser/Thr protein kinase)
MEVSTGLERTMSIFSAALEIPYDLRFIVNALNWVTELTMLAGGGRQEAGALRSAGDETLAFIINSYPNAEIWERIRMEFSLLTDGMIEIAITNAGPPVHMNRIPQYDPRAPAEANMDGLWYFLAREAVDDFMFQNNGHKGWRVIMRKRLPEIAFTMKPSLVKTTDAPVPKSLFVTRLAVPEDAPDIMDLTYDTYRYTYPGEVFYHESKLREALATGKITSLVVEANGLIVGNASFVIHN